MIYEEEQLCTYTPLVVHICMYSACSLGESAAFITIDLANSTYYSSYPNTPFWTTIHHRSASSPQQHCCDWAGPSRSPY